MRRSTSSPWKDYPAARGSFRFPNPLGLHEYVNDRFLDPVYYAPEDALAYAQAEPLFDVELEYAGGSTTIPSSYCFSPAAMLDPDVLRAPSEGGFQDPMDLDFGYRSPPVDAARYPDLKTWIIEHNWLRGPPGPCNPGFMEPLGEYSPDCNPYLFNQGADAAPLTAFFDGSIRRLRSGDVAADDQLVLEFSGGVDGLWSRDTPLGSEGYFGDFSFDGIVVSHHVLTTGGILGRDRLGE